MAAAQPDTLLSVEAWPQRRAEPVVSGAAYAMLFLLGAMEGLVGCFQFSRSVGAVPVAALILCAALLATCLLGAVGVRSPLGALAPAAGWFLVALILTMPTSAGSVVVTNTAAGEWFLYGGALCAAAAVAVAVTGRLRIRPPRPPGGGGPLPPG